jgi:hypothetical protein
MATPQPNERVAADGAIACFLRSLFYLLERLSRAAAEGRRWMASGYYGSISF